MTRSVFAVAAGLLCGLYGLRLSSALREESQVLHRWTEMLARLELLISEETLPLPDVMLHAADGSLPPDRLMRDVAQAITADPLLSLQDAFSARCPAFDGHDVLLRLFARLGRGSSSSRRLAVQQAHDALALLAAQKSDRAARDAKMYRTLGWTAGACLTIMLL